LNLERVGAIVLAIIFSATKELILGLAAVRALPQHAMHGLRLLHSTEQDQANRLRQHEVPEVWRGVHAEEEVPGPPLGAPCSNPDDEKRNGDVSPIDYC